MGIIDDGSVQSIYSGGFRMIISTRTCDKCNLICVERELTVCIHYDTQEVLGHLCDDCVKDWLKHLDTLDEGAE